MLAQQSAPLAMCLFAGIAAVYDYRTGHIPNRLMWVAFVSGVVLVFCGAFTLAPAAGSSPGGQLGAASARVLLGMVVCLLVPLLLYKLNAIGGGDVKLFGCVGASFGPALGLEVELWAFALAALYAPARMAFEGRLWQLVVSSSHLMMAPFLPKSRGRKLRPALTTWICMAPAVFFGTVLVTALHWAGR